MNQTVPLDFVADTEDVARILFSPLFISEGILSQKAFTLELQTNETYISVLRPAVPSFKDDMEGIKKDGKRKSHAGIFATIGKEKVRGGSPQSVGRMLLRMHLVELAQNRIERLSGA